MSQGPAMAKSDRRFVLFFMIVIVVIAIPALYVPWAFYLGGSFHVMPYWQGWGRAHSNSAGGDYLIYIFFYPDHGRFRSLAYVQGNGSLCTPRGEKFSLKVGGNFDKPSGRDSNGQRVGLYVYNRSVKTQLLGGYHKPSLNLRGKWSNPDLVMDDDGSIARNFNPDGSLVESSAGRPYKAEVSQITFHQGSVSDFNAACDAVKKR